MNSRQQIEIALQGGKPDRVPILAHYSYEYIMHSLGRDPREWVMASAEDRTRTVEAMFLRHEIDGYFVYPGVTYDSCYRNLQTEEKFDDYWIVTNRETGERFRLLPDGQRTEVDGTPILSDLSSSGIVKIQTRDDLDPQIPPPPSEAEIEDSGWYSPLRYMAEKYPNHHFSFAPGSLMGSAMTACGGFEEGLVTLALNRDLFKEILHRVAKNKCAYLAPGSRAGGRSVWLTSMYTGAEIISPRDYAEVVFPAEHEFCQAAKEQGLYVLDWFLGDLMPVLDKVMELPIDSLLLEQGRGSYVIDLAEIRQQVGPRFCLHGFAYEFDYIEFNRESITHELNRQIEGAGRDGAFIVSTSIMPANAQPEAVEFYFSEAHRLGRYQDVPDCVSPVRDVE